MHGRIKSVAVELTIVITSDDLGYTKRDAIVRADEYVAENYPGEQWDRIDEELDKYNAWSVRYERSQVGHRDRLFKGEGFGPDWGASE